MPKRLDLLLESDLASVELAEERIVVFCESAGYGDSQCTEIGLAVRECVANAVLHGNRCDLAKKVALEAEIRESELVICIKDEGEGFDPASLPDPSDPSHLLQASGRGVFLLKSLMDEVILRRPSSGMEVTLVKHLPNGQVASKKCPKEENKVNLKTSSRQVDGVTIVDLSGRIVLGEETSALRELLKDLLGRGQKKILLNLADVNYIDSSGLGTLVSGFTTLTGQQGQLKLLNLTKKVHDLLQITKLLTVFEVFEDEVKAVRSFT